MTTEISKSSVPATARDRILTTAAKLFNEFGVNETGIDRIIAEGGFAKKTFYHHFKSKHDLIEAYLRHRDVLWFERLSRFTQDTNRVPLDRFLALFDALKEWFQEPDFFGCPFVWGLSDFNDLTKSKSLQSCVSEHFQQTEKLVAQLLKPVRPKDYKKFVPLMISLITGTVVIAYATKNPKVADSNKEMARRLLS